MTIQTTAGATLHVSAAQPATYDSTGYAALTWTAVGEITDLGEFGREYELIRHNPINTRATKKLKGSYDEGSVQLQLASDTDDAGQILLKTASTSDSDYSFKITMQNGDKYYAQAKVSKFKVQPGSVNNVVGLAVGLELTTNSAGVGIVEALAP